MEKKLLVCTACKHEKPRRRVIARKSLRDVTEESILAKFGYREYLCENTIEILIKKGITDSGKPTYKWVREECGNHMLRDPRKYKI